MEAQSVSLRKYSFGRASIPKIKNHIIISETALFQSIAVITTHEKAKFRDNRMVVTRV